MIDALNRRKLLPYEYFSNWDVRSAWLRGTFDNMPGKSRVTRGEFAMFKQFSRRTGPEIPQHECSRKVLPGDEVVVSMLVVTKDRRSKCYRCRSRLSNTVFETEWTEWYVCVSQTGSDVVADMSASAHCKKSYRLIETRRSAARDESADTLSSEPENKGRTSDTLVDEREEIDTFVRVHSRRLMVSCNTIWYALAFA
jgi:hypothetical protein